MADKKQTILDLFPNEGAVLKRVHRFLISGSSNQARMLIDDYIKAKKERRTERETKSIKKEKKPDRPEMTKEIATQIVKSIEENFDEDVRKDMEDLRERSKDSKSLKEVVDYDRAMAKRKELKEKFNI